MSTIDVSKLISAAVLQLPFVDKQGNPLSGGIVTFYQSDMMTLKNVYYQVGTVGNYQYITAPNPMVLSGAGTPMDVNGNDIILFYYPYNDDPIAPNPNQAVPYFVQVQDSNFTLQFTRYNFPFVSTSGTPASVVATLDNYIINNRFWRNVGTINANVLPGTWTTQYQNSGTYYYQTLAPDQHDGFSMPDFNYIKNVNGSCSETISFIEFPATSGTNLIGDIGPEFYLNHNTTADSSGSTLKIYQFPISLHQATLVGTPFTFTIQGQWVSGNTEVSIYLYQFYGTNSLSPLPQLLGTFNFTSTWTKYTIPGLSFPETNSAFSLSNAGDDAFYIQIAMPTGSSAGVCNLNYTVPSIYLSPLEEDVPTNSFSTYDQIDSVVLTPRTGDIRTSVNQFFPFGWVPMNDGVLGFNAGSVVPTATIPGYVKAGSDTWPLYYLLWNLAVGYDTGSNFNPICQMYSNSGTTLTATNYGATAYADFNSNNAIALTKMFGQVIMGTVPNISTNNAYNSNYNPQSQGVTCSSSGGMSPSIIITPVSITPFWIGAPLVFGTASGTLPGNILANILYYVTNITSTTFQVSVTYADALAGTPVVAYISAGSNVYIGFDPTGAVIGEYSHLQLTSEVGTHLHPPLSPATAFLSSASGGNAISGSGNFINEATTGNNTGNGRKFNVTQPGTFYNIYIKL